MIDEDDYDPELAQMVLAAASRFEPLPGGPLAPKPCAAPPALRVRQTIDAPRAPFRLVVSVTRLRVGWVLWLACGPGHVNFTDDSRVATCKKMRCKQCGASTPALPQRRRAPRLSMEEIADGLGRLRPRAERMVSREDLEAPIEASWSLGRWNGKAFYTRTG